MAAGQTIRKLSEDFGVETKRMASAQILIATVPEDHRNTLISSSTNQLRTMLPAKTAVTMSSVKDSDERPRPACLAYLDPKPNVGPRKRQRLNHLTPDEKLMRRYVDLFTVGFYTSFCRGP